MLCANLAPSDDDRGRVTDFGTTFCNTTLVYGGNSILLLVDGVFKAGGECTARSLVDIDDVALSNNMLETTWQLLPPRLVIAEDCSRCKQ